MRNLLRKALTDLRRRKIALEYRIVSRLPRRRAAAAGHAQGNTAAKSVLIVGHSHVRCMEAALEQGGPAGDVAVVNIWKIPKFSALNNKELAYAVFKKSAKAAPDAICLCLGGSYHNILGLIENPVPFSVGEDSRGAAPEQSPERHFIPYGLAKAMFRERFSQMPYAEIFDAFPSAQRYCINPPPPGSDWKKLKRNPGIFRDKLKLGPAPESLRLQLYHVQTEVFREIAEHHGARFIEPGPRIFDQSGFLAADYYSDDVTHGNATYGNVMLEKILETVGASR